MPRCRSCSPKLSCGPPKVVPPGCSPQNPGSLCAAPTPRGTTNYYNRHHEKIVDDNCKGSCYCPDTCHCPHRGIRGRFVCPRSCDPCAKVDCCPGRCCSPGRGYDDGGGGGCGGGGCPPVRCCSAPPRRCCPPKCSSPPSYGPQESGPPCSPCSPCPPPCLDPCFPCAGPYCPPRRRPVCYPPVTSCEPNPCERICYYPCPPPCAPKYCTCGSPNPCDCDLNAKRRLVEADRAPCCRRCGRKVYAAEKIMASGGAFHTCCFSCYCCHKALEVTSLYENQGEIYCKHCYAKHFGVTGYGYGMTLQSPL